MFSGRGANKAFATLLRRRELEAECGKEVIQLLLDMISTFIMCLPLRPENYFPWELYYSVPESEILLDGHGAYGERSYSRWVNGGPTTAELLRLIRRSSNVQFQAVLAETMGNFLPPGADSRFTIQERRSDQLEAVLTFGRDGQKVALERIRTHIYTYGSEKRGAGHQDASSRVLRLVWLLPLCRSPEDAVRANEQGNGTGRGIHLAGRFFHRPTNKTIQWEAYVEYLGSQLPHVFVLHPDIGVRGEFMSRDGNGFVDMTRHKATNAGQDAATGIVMLGNLSTSTRPDFDLNAAFEHARLRASLLEWSGCDVRTIFPMDPALAKVPPVERRNLLRRVQINLDELAEGEGGEEKGALLDLLGLRALSMDTAQSTSGDVDDVGFFDRTSMDSSESTDPVFTPPGSTVLAPLSPTQSALSAVSTVWGALTPVLPTSSLVTAGAAAAVVLGPTTGVERSSSGKEKRLKSGSVEGYHDSGFQGSGPNQTRPRR